MVDKKIWIWKEGVVARQTPAADIFGFVYIIRYTNGQKYIGKKQIWSKITKPALQSGIVRDNAVRIHKNLKGKRTPLDVVTSESDWRDYVGSSKETKGLVIENKEILELCYDKINLTYCECKWMFNLDVIVDDDFLNSNILGKFYKGKIK